MANPRSPRFQLLFAFQLLLLLQLQTKSFCHQYKVGDLDGWGIPTSANPLVYAKWSKYHTFAIGDSLCKFPFFFYLLFNVLIFHFYLLIIKSCMLSIFAVFLYPPSQDSVIQVTAQSYDSCKLKDPILYMNNGNSLFNITKEGNFYFTSGEPGHCQKKQKLHFTVGNVSAESPAYGPSALPDFAPSYPTVFGSIPQPPSSSPSLSFSGILTAVIGSAACAILSGIM